MKIFDIHYIFLQQQYITPASVPPALDEIFCLFGYFSSSLLRMGKNLSVILFLKWHFS